MDLIKVRKAHLEKVFNHIRENKTDYYELSEVMDYPFEEKDGVVSITQDCSEWAISFREMADELMAHSVPYVFFDDGKGEYDDYWEYYNPDVNESPKTANYSCSQTGYIFEEHNLEELIDLPVDEFKQAVIEFFKNPFKDYPSLESLED